MDTAVVLFGCYILLIIILVELYYRYKYLPTLKDASKRGYRNW